MRLCIYPGTFNPIHNVHLTVAEFALRYYKFDTILFIPAYKPPHKEIDDAMATHRYNMVKLAIEGNTRFQISNIEYQNERFSYTYFTVVELYKRYKPEGKINILIGTDAFREIDSWKFADDLKKQVHFIVYPRTKNFHEKNFQRFTEWNYDYEFAPMEFIDLSSTVLRSRIYKGKPCNGLLPDKVLDYIKENGLYQA